MPSRVRNTFAVVVGAAVAVTVVFVGDAVVHHFWPLPPGIDAQNRAQMHQALAAFPLIAFLVLVCGWMLATALGAFVATRLSSPRHARGGRLVTILILLGTIANLAGIHHPGWMWPAAILLVLLGGWIGTRVGLGATASGGSMRFLIILVAGVTFDSATHSPSPIATAVLRSLRADTSALAHIQVDSVRPALVIERPYENSGWQFGFLFHWPRISKSTRCQWRGLPRDSIEHLVHVMARVDSSVLVRRHAAETRLRENRRPQLVVFVSPEFRGMHLVGVFSFYPEREARGGRVTNYASFNQGLEYVTCGTGDRLELLGPSRVTYD